MTGGLPAAFYAPLKSPRHPAPSGDRTMARLLSTTLVRAGFAPDLASEVRTLDKHGDRDAQDRAVDGRHPVDGPPLRVRPDRLVELREVVGHALDELAGKCGNGSAGLEPAVEGRASVGRRHVGLEQDLDREASLLPSRAQAVT